jgi:hypothetical protein
MASAKRARSAGEGAVSTQGDSGDEGAGEGTLARVEEIQAIHKRIKEIQKDHENLAEKIEALNHALWDFGEDGKKFSVMKKALGMSNFHHAWIKHAEEVFPQLLMPDRGNGTWKNK